MYGITVEDYFKRFDWALELSQVPEGQHASYARVHMTVELNNPLKFLISPLEPESLTYPQIRSLISMQTRTNTQRVLSFAKYNNSRCQKWDEEEGITVELNRCKCNPTCKRNKNPVPPLRWEEKTERTQVRMWNRRYRPRCFRRSQVCSLMRSRLRSQKLPLQSTTSQHPPSHEAIKLTGPSTYNETTHALISTPVQVKRGKPFVRGRSASRGRNPNPASRSASRKRGKDGNNWSACNGCGATHSRRRQCPFREAECHICQRKGRIARVCRSGNSSATKNYQIKTVEQPAEAVDSSTNRQFISYSHHRLVCKGYVTVHVTLGTITRELDLYAIDDDYDSLFGREWIASFAHEINWTQIFKPHKVHNLTATPPHLTLDQT
ncbi:uncharacterized protein LOC126265922 [Aethina tumida]|uniref:uncharacterized protein LOC126265922 n=1 Tax=Aethina tumida TaxID=116153 RepID=UPI0021473732|nr:uncharacterized protein LOC126265922 [Aethina tumida]